MTRIFFTADTHIFHTNIVKHCPDRPYPEMNVDKAHDEWLIDLWNSKIGKQGIVSIVGDFAFGNKIMVTKLLGKLRGQNCPKTPFFS